MNAVADGLALSNYAKALSREAVFAAESFELAQTSVLASLTVGASALFVLMFVRRSGTAAAAFALVVLTALSEAIAFGTLDFVTPGTRTLIACLTASALLLFVNAVLHTGRENIVIAGLSALVIAGLLGLGGASAAGLPYGDAAHLGVLGATLLSAALLVFGMVRNFRQTAFLGLALLAALLATFLMTDLALPATRSLMPVLAPAVLAASGILLAALTSPFIGDEVRLPSMREQREARASLMPTSLFDDDVPAPTYTGPASGERARDPRFSFPAPGAGPAAPPPEEEFLAPPPGDERPAEDLPASGPDDAAPVPATFLPVPQTSGAETDEPAEPSFGRGGDPVSNHWASGVTDGVLAAAENEYVWDALAQPEVRCGEGMLEACGATAPESLTPEGIREHLSPESLILFDDEVLGGPEPQSGPFDVALRSRAGHFRFTGRRRVDHDAILMRIDGEVMGFSPVREQETPPLSRDQTRGRFDFPGVVMLKGRKTTGLLVHLGDAEGRDEDIKRRIDDAGHALALRLEDEPRSGAFALIDGPSASVKPGVLASAVGKAVRVHELPRGAMVVGLRAADLRSARELAAAAEDLRSAGAGFALMIDEPQAKPGKTRPDMVMVHATDVLNGRRVRKTAIQSISRRFGCPVVVLDVKDAFDADEAADRGAIFATGPAFLDRDDNPAAPADSGGGDALAQLRARGLR